MKKCAKCDFEYDDAYDGCPVCARTTSADPAPASGSMFGAFVALMAFVFLAGFTVVLLRSSLGAYLALAIFAAVVTLDAYQIVKPGRKLEGILGTHPLAWGALVLLIAVVGVPLYFYQRPRIVAAYGTL